MSAHGKKKSNLTTLEMSSLKKKKVIRGDK